MGKERKREGKRGRITPAKTKMAFEKIRGSGWRWVTQPLRKMHLLLLTQQKDPAEYEQAEK